MHRNNIKSIAINGVQVTNHSVKIQTLTEHFRAIVGTLGTSTWHFDCGQLYQDLPKANDDLTGPFTEQEAVAAVRSMNRSSAPGPDGFGPSFYSAAWQTVKEEVIGFLTAFYVDSVQLERVNMSHMVLLQKKKPDANTVDAFRPICLQNCCVKILSKILTTRLQTVGSLVGLEGVTKPAKAKLELLSNSICGTAALCPQHCSSATLPGQNSGTAALADNFEAQFKICGRKHRSEKLLSFL
jgi:hypothetical protein